MEPLSTSKKPTVLFLCVHNAGRSQMAAGLMESHAKGLVNVRSAGSQPASALNPTAVAAMAEIGIDIAAKAPRALSADDPVVSDVVVSMGCGDTCPILPGTRYVDWPLEDPAGKDLATVRRIRDEIDALVVELLRDLGVDHNHTPGANPN